ncbi:hypothetical protein BS78_08G142200 [Paspalum vaginatum]|nr:hypothetical protein BS78_08G142200 [Paspalum vaginatum]
MEAQKCVRGDLHDWDRNVLGELEKRISKVKKELERCRRQVISSESVSQEHLLRYKLERLQEQLNIYWKQRSHTAWLTKGNRNTRLFHAMASERRRRNMIKKLRKEDGGVVEGTNLKEFIADHYKNLFQSNTSAQAEEVLSCVSPRITGEMNAMLMKTFTEEVWNALQAIGDLKAPGPDGIPSIFYKKFWALLGDTVKKEVLSVLNGGPMPQGWNDTIITLIPKITCQKKVLKAKYFPRESILTVGPKGGISYTWRSILKGLELVKQGYIRRIRDGTNVNIWTDPWLPRRSTRRVTIPRRNSILHKVSELINPFTVPGMWT